MTRSEPTAVVTCDSCGGEETFDLRWRSGGYAPVDDYDLFQQGWLTSGDKDFCYEDCARAELSPPVNCDECGSEPKFDIEDILAGISDDDIPDHLLNMGWVFIGGKQFCDGDCAQRFYGDLLDLVELAGEVSG